MGKPTGFLEYTRCDNAVSDPKVRIRNFREFHQQLGEAERRTQGARCMNCGVPLCQSGIELHGRVTGCPLHNLIPEWNDQIYRGNDGLALARLLKNNNFPEFTGRVCPSLCEKACICGMNSDPVTVRDNELFLIEKAFETGEMPVRVPAVRSGKKIAVVGSGPAGLAAADQLNHRGHTVTVYEREEEIGGLLMFGIPNMKLDKSVILRRRKLMEAEGVTFQTGVNVGVDITADKLLAEYDAIVLCTGAKEPRPVQAKGLDAVKSGCWYAVDFLSEVTRELLSGKKENVESLVRGKDVVIVGGGDTGNDCVGTAIRLGCRSVTQLEMMPKPPLERADSNPWPEWPNIYQVDYGQEESQAKFGRDPRVYETTLRSVASKEGKITGVETVKLKWEGRKMSEISGSEKSIPCGLLLIAAGFLGPQKYTPEAFGVDLTKRSTVATEPEHYRTSRERIFTAGDMHRGQSLVVWAITEGRACAREVDASLMGYSEL